MKLTAVFIGALAMCAFFVGCTSMDDGVMAMSRGSPSLQELGPLTKVKVTIWETNGGTTYVSSDPKYLEGLARVARKFPDEYLATPPINLVGERIETRVFARSSESRWMCVQSGSLILEDGFYSGLHTEHILQLGEYLSSIKSVHGVKIEPAKRRAPNRAFAAAPKAREFAGVFEIQLWAAKESFGGFKVDVVRHGEAEVAIVRRSFTSGFHSCRLSVFAKDDGRWVEALTLKPVWGTWVDYQQSEDVVSVKVGKEASEVLRFSISKLRPPRRIE